MDRLTSRRAFFFDLFGTLLVFSDFDRAQELWMTAFYESAGKPNHFSFEQSSAVGDRILHSRAAKDEMSGLSTYETKIVEEFERLGVAISREQLRGIADETLDAWQAGIKLARDAERVLTALRGDGRKTVLITNFDHAPHVRKLLAEAGLRSLFDRVLISDEVGCRKPDARIFQIAMEQVGVSAEEVVHIGDSVHDDVQGAAAVGITPILIDRKSKSNEDDLQPPTARPDDLRVIGSLSELVG